MIQLWKLSIFDDKYSTAALQESSKCWCFSRSVKGSKTQYLLRVCHLVIPLNWYKMFLLMQSSITIQGRKKNWNPLVQWASTFRFSVAPTKCYLANRCPMFMPHQLHHLLGNCFWFYWKLSLTRLLRLISLAHWTTKLPLSLAQEQNLLAPGNQTWSFSCPAICLVNETCSEICWGQDAWPADMLVKGSSCCCATEFKLYGPFLKKNIYIYKKVFNCTIALSLNCM